MATEISVDDRFRIQDVLRSYVWANDAGSVPSVVAAFTPDGTVQSTGEPIPVRRWAIETFAQPGGADVNTGCSTLRSRAPRKEIGRASCRERVEISGGGRCVKRKRYEAARE